VEAGDGLRVPEHAAQHRSNAGGKGGRAALVDLGGGLADNRRAAIAMTAGWRHDAARRAAVHAHALRRAYVALDVRRIWQIAPLGPETEHALRESG